MSLITSVGELLNPSSRSAPRTSNDGSRGAYWCDDCAIRVRDVDVESDDLDTDPDGEPTCPDCGQPMRFELFKGSSCAC